MGFPQVWGCSNVAGRRPRLVKPPPAMVATTLIISTADPRSPVNYDDQMPNSATSCFFVLTCLLLLLLQACLMPSRCWRACTPTA